MMEKIIEEWTYDILPEEAKRYIAEQYVVDRITYNKATTWGIQASNIAKKDEEMGDNLFGIDFGDEIGETGGGDSTEEELNLNLTIDDLTKGSIIWATDNYINSDGMHNFKDHIDNFQLIRPRTEKTIAEQKKRVKEKAEVFTPSWVCNLQNNLIDNQILGKNSFNKVSDDDREWKSSIRVKFKEDYRWTDYILEKRLEICCGEGPYLFSRYDTTTGVNIPVRVIKRGRSDWRRIGLLDRKLRVVSENVDNIEDWLTAAKVSLRNTYGFEWQGDNLFLARMNMLNTFFDYYHDYVKNTLKIDEKTLNVSSKDLCVEVSEIVSLQLWQMDGLKFVIPESCSAKCEGCLKKRRTGHDGLQPVFNWSGEYRTFEFIHSTN